MSGKHRFATEEIEKFSTVDLIAELKRRYQVLSRPERSCVLVGAPCSGTTTQSSFLRKEWGLCSIERGDIIQGTDTDLNSAVTKLSEEIGSFRCRRGFVITNFPQTSQEAKLFDDMIRSKHVERADYKVILLDVPHEDHDSAAQQLMNRATGHLVHVPSGRVYNSNIPELKPQTQNVDDITGEALTCPRLDLASVRNRMLSWWEERKPDFSKFYGDRLSTVDASRSRDAVSMDISRLLLASELPESYHAFSRDSVTREEVN